MEVGLNKGFKLAAADSLAESIKGKTALKPSFQKVPMENPAEVILLPINVLLEKKNLESVKRLTFYFQIPFQFFLVNDIVNIN